LINVAEIGLLENEFRITCTSSVAQWKRAGLITQRS
jgi:hypothetical protein